jgi:hypothetical protein
VRFAQDAFASGRKRLPEERAQEIKSGAFLMKRSGAQVVRQKFGKTSSKFVMVGILLAWSAMASAQQWIAPTTPPQFNVGIALLLTDGTIMVQENKTPNWWKLTPDINGFYRFGSWTQLAAFPPSMGYAPTYFASAVLPDGKVIVEGGEDNNGVQDWTPMGAIYDPVANTWTEVFPPAGWTKIGDASSVVLPDGTFMLANCCDNPAQAALFDESTLTWTVLKKSSGFAGKFDRNNEEGWTLLPGGNVLTVDTYTGIPYNPTGMNSEIYNPSAGAWSTAGSTGVQLWDSKAACGGPAGSTREIGPAVLRPDGKVFATGSNTCGTAGHTSLYDTKTGVWTPGPDVPGKNDAADAPAALLPDGNVLLDTNPGWGKNPSTLYEFAYNGTGWMNIPQPAGLDPSNTEGARMLMTADGTVLLTHVGTPNMWFYIPAGTFKAAWRPTVSSCPATVALGNTYTVKGTKFNGWSQDAAYGDDAQSATNYPIVRIQNDSTLHYFFARSHDPSTMAVATGALATSTEFDVLFGTELGPSTLTVIANGIPSAACKTTVEQ